MSLISGRSLIAVMARISGMLVSLALACFGEISRANLVINGYDANRHDRFTNHADFLGSEQDWSGVGRIADGKQWATMISPSYFLSATHAHPSGTLRFFHSNDNTVAGTFEDHTISGTGWQIADSDLWLGKLTTQVSAEVAKYSIFDAPTFNNRTIHLLGQSGPDAKGMRLGRNVIDAKLSDFSDPALGASQGDVFIFDYDTSTNGLGDDEARVESGDSGAPSFVLVDGQPAVVGIHWFKYTTDDMLTPNRGSGDTLVSSYIDDLTATMSGETLTVVAVPEPAAYWLLSIVTAVLAAKWKVTTMQATQR